MPFPGVNLAKLKPKVEDQYPASLIEPFERDVFKNYYNEILVENFGEEYNLHTRLFDNLEMIDQYTGKHLLPFFLSKITNPDQSILKFDEDGNPIRGLRTFGELAHFVRCIPFKDHEGFSAH